MSAQLADLGAIVIDHDQLAREAVAIGSPGLAQIVRIFGADALHPDGSLNRPLLGQRVFANPEALAQLNEVVHPEVFRLSEAAEAAAQEADPHAVIVHDIPLLVETGQQGNFDLLVVVDTPAAVRIERLINLRDMSAADARARVESQISDAERRAPADVILDGGAPLWQLRQQVEQLWRDICARTVQRGTASAGEAESS